MKELTGVGVYTQHFLTELLAIDHDNHYHLFFNALKGDVPLITRSLRPNATFTRRRIPGKLLLEIWRRWQRPTIEELARSNQVDVFHSPNFLYQPSRCRNIVSTVHDIAFLKSGQYGSRYAGKYHRVLLLQHLERARSIIACSNSVKSDLVNMLSISEERISVIHHGIDPQFLEPRDLSATRARLKRAGYPDRYIVSVGTLEPRKNYPLLLEGFSRIAPEFPDLKLVIVGRHADGLVSVSRQIRDLHLDDRVMLPGYVTGDLLPDLYRGACVSVFSSWDEGFGIPPLESIACGTPVVVSDIPVFHETLGDAALYFSLTDLDSLELWLKKVMTDSHFMSLRREIGLKHVERYSWKEAAQKHQRVYENASA